MIPFFDLVGTAGFVAATALGVRNYRQTEVAQVFWLSFTFAAALGAVWLALVALEWLGVRSVLLDVFSTSLQAVVIGVFAVGTVGGLAALDDLRDARTETERQRRKAEAARRSAQERTRELEGIQVLLREVEAMANVGGWEQNLETGTFRVTRGIRHIIEGAEQAPSRLADLIEYVHPDDRDAFRGEIDHCRETGERFDLEHRVITTTGKEVWVQSRGGRVEEAEGTVVRGVIQDISDRRERDQQLMVFNRVLRHNLRNKLTIILGYANALEDDLTPAAQLEESGHRELRKAIAALEDADGEAEVNLDVLEDLADALAAFPAATVRSYAEKIAKSSADVSDLSEKIAEFQRATRPESTSETVAVRPIADRLRSVYASRFPDAEIELGNLDVSIQANEEGLRLVLRELVENAIVHHDGDAPRVFIEAEAAPGGRVAVRIRDAGPGIPPVERQVLERGEETPISHGSGIGLWTVHWIMSRFGGSIEISENDPEGTVVELVFPGVE